MTAFFDEQLQAAGWMPAESAAWQRAAAEQRLMVILLGEAGDHWAAEWARRLLADEECGQVIDELFVAVADEARAVPGLADAVQLVLGQTAGARGWPALAVALPDGRLVGAVPYSPVRDAERRVGVLRMLLDAASAWAEAPEQLQHDAAQFAAGLQQLQHAGGELPRRALTMDRAEAEAMAQADELEGGFGPEPRRLDPALMLFLLRRCDRPLAPPALRQQVERTLTAAVAGALHDHLGGGFFSATEDAAWNRPLTQKTLGQNAQVVVLLAEGARIFDQPLLRQAAEAAFDWCYAALARPWGAWVAGWHAESPGAGGRPTPAAYYAWNEAAAAEVVGAEGAGIFARRFLADDRGVLDEAGFQVPAVRGQLAPAERDRLPAICRRLAVARSERPTPAVRERAWLADQAQLLLAAISLAADEERFAPAVEQLGTALDRWLGDEPLQAPAWCSADATGAAADSGGLAWAAQALARWAAVDGDDDRRRRARALVEQLHGRLLGGEDDVGDEGHPAPGPTAAGIEADGLIGLDSPQSPAPAAVLAEAWLTWADADHAVNKRVEELLQAHGQLISGAPLATAGLLAAWDQLPGS